MSSVLTLTPAKFVVPRGTTKRFTLTVKLDGVLLDLTGAKLYATVKERIDDDAGTLILKRNTAAGGSDSEFEILTPQTGTGALTGQCKLKFVPADTKNLKPKIYVIDVFVVLSNGEVYQVQEPCGFEVGIAVTRL